MHLEVKEFWAQTFRALGNIQPAPREVSNRSDFYVTMREVVMRSWQNIRFQSMMVIPRSIQKPLDKAIIYVGGSGFNNGYRPRPQFWFEDAVTFMVDPRGQGHSRMDIQQPDHFTYGVRAKESYRYRGVYCDIKKAVDYLVSQGYRKIGMGGTCFGGGVAVAMAALDKRIKAVAVDTPWPANIIWAVEHRIPGYEMMWKMLDQHPHLKREVYDTVRFFDPVELADECTVPTLIGMNRVDPRVHRYTMKTLYDRIAGTKCLVEYAKTQHGCDPTFNIFQRDWFRMWL